MGGYIVRDPSLPSFAGLSVTGVGSSYNVGCAAIYLNLS